MATVTSNPGPAKVGTQQIITRTRVTDRGNNNYYLEVIRNDANNINGTGTVIAQTDSKGTLKPTENATTQEKSDIQNTQSSLRNAISQQKNSLEKQLGIDTPEKKSAFNKTGGGSGNQANNADQKTPNGTPTSNKQDTEAFGKENDSFKTGTRDSYGDVTYPLNLRVETQDCIKFTILKYRPSSAKNTGNKGVGRLVTLQSGSPTISSSTRLGTITLPIPSGITDSNGVNWQDDTMNKLQEQFGQIAKDTILGGAEAGAKSATTTGKTFSDYVNSGEGQQGITGLIAGMAVNSQRFQQRAFGSTFNNNLELLFDGPSLRSFSFSFKLSPRSGAEAKAIMKIIRFFKQAMAVKRSQTSLLLKTPHTFAISYISADQQHPYLNKFKECALTNVSVDYTPEGQYMTYMSPSVDERSMISYNLSLSFQELEPVFDDDYGNESPDKLTGVGY